MSRRNKIIATLLALLTAAATWTWGGPPLPTKYAPPTLAYSSTTEVKHYKDAAEIDFTGKQIRASKGKRGLSSGGHLVRYGWDWNETIDVIDLTGNPRWEVEGTVAKWAKSGFDIQMTTDPNVADIFVQQGDAYAVCGAGYGGVIGCASTTVVNGEPQQGSILMEEDFADWAYDSLLVGGFAHESAHTLGWTHATGLTNEQTVTGVPLPASCNPFCASTVPTNLDRAAVRGLT